MLTNGAGLDSAIADGRAAVLRRLVESTQASLVAALLGGIIAGLSARSSSLRAQNRLALLVGGAIRNSGVVIDSETVWLRRGRSWRRKGGVTLSDLLQVTILAAVLRRRVTGSTAGLASLGTEDLFSKVVGSAIIVGRVEGIAIASGGTRGRGRRLRRGGGLLGGLGSSSGGRRKGS